MLGLAHVVDLALDPELFECLFQFLAHLLHLSLFLNLHKLQLVVFKLQELDVLVALVQFFVEELDILMTLQIESALLIELLLAFFQLRRQLIILLPLFLLNFSELTELFAIVS